ncbi:DUF3672 domain-containing protein [Shewanella submarina]|uniref:DUF3672 domain-containing protein n=1 Tax=Shewanella submarina TaxID=2016376 RepID=A0ABV7G8F6_9GAMM|nr:DUF3672 domain-containing protein [Shewanella submarina]MCL1038334.1 DUF3672 domain-containing protein [Shewanella submarina]
MIKAPAEALEALKSGRFFYANLYTLNLGDAYGTGTDFVLYMTDAGHSVKHLGITYQNNKGLLQVDGIARKMEAGSDKIDFKFSATEKGIVDAVNTRAYMAKAQKIERVLLDDNSKIIANWAMPIRTAWAISHEISSDRENPEVTLTADTANGNLNETNSWLTSPESHQARYPGDKIMNEADQARKAQGKQAEYTGVSAKETVPPDAVSVVYGKAEVELLPLIRFKWRTKKGLISKTKHYHTAIAAVVCAGEIESVDIKSIKIGDEIGGVQWNRMVGKHTGLTGAIRYYDQTNQDLASDPMLAAWRQYMPGDQFEKLKGMYGHGLTIVFLKFSNRDGYKDDAINITVPVKGIKCLDPRIEAKRYTTNPAIQLSDYLENKLYGAGVMGIKVNGQSIKDAANHFDKTRETQFAPNKLLETKFVVDTGEALQDNIKTFMDSAFMFTSDYYGDLMLRVEKPSTPVMDISAEDCEDTPEITAVELGDRVNMQFVTIDQYVPDPKDNTKQISVSVDVAYPSLTIPAEKAIHERWKKEDGGRNLQASESADQVMNTNHAKYIAAVLARKSRFLDEIKLTVSPIGWVLEPGDVIRYTDEIAGQTNRHLWINAVSETDEGAIDIEAVAHYDETYSPDLAEIPDPEPPATNPDMQPISEPRNLKATLATDEFYQGTITWDEPAIGADRVAQYFVAIDHEFINEGGSADSETVLTFSNVKAEEVRFDKLEAGKKYRASVIPYASDGSPGATASVEFNVGLPQPPDILEVETGSTTLVIRPRFTKQPPASYKDIRFKFWISSPGYQPSELLSLAAPPGAKELGIGHQMPVDNLLPEKTYTVYAATVTPWGESERYSQASATTKSAADIWTGAVSSDNGMGWVRSPTGSWLPNTKPINLTAEFTKPSESAPKKAAVRVTLDTTNQNFTASLVSADTGVTVKISPPGATTFTTVEFIHESGTRIAQTISLVLSGTAGRPGDPGEDGKNGKTIRVAYTKSKTKPLKPTGTVYPPSGWFADPPAISRGEFVWSSYTTADKATGTPVDDSWTSPAQMTGEIGDDGTPGTPGKDGSPGKDGRDGKTIRGVYKVAAYAPAKPIGSTIPPSGWLLAVPKSVPPGQHVFASYTWAENETTSKGSGVWTQPGQLSGSDGNNGKDGANGERGTKHLNIQAETASGWSDSLANSEFDKNYKGKVQWDSMTQYSKSRKWSITKAWMGNAWIAQEAVLDGNLLVHGTVTGTHIQGKTITGGNIAGSTITGANVVAGTLTGTHINAASHIKVGSHPAVAYLSGSHGTHRIWAGHDDPRYAKFAVDKYGNINIAGSGTIGENITVNGTVKANKIIGDIVSSKVITTKAFDNQSGTIEVMRVSVTNAMGKPVSITFSEYVCSASPGSDREERMQVIFTLQRKLSGQSDSSFVNVDYYNHIGRTGDRRDWYDTIRCHAFTDSLSASNAKYDYRILVRRFSGNVTLADRSKVTGVSGTQRVIGQIFRQGSAWS